ncbi:hypothetical protein LTR10_003483 [Elasticomyces elasticus]|nr:hypothetical protein LTR10_003483 [Elasticomyces elasticus]KAK4969751.1 hypothetical protein LTR42_009023 [Elasticomyces elasticus]
MSSFEAVIPIKHWQAFVTEEPACSCEGWLTDQSFLVWHSGCSRDVDGPGLEYGEFGYAQPNLCGKREEREALQAVVATKHVLEVVGEFYWVHARGIPQEGFLESSG